MIPSRPGMKFVCEMRPGDRLIVYRGKVIVVNPNFPPEYVTEKGLVPMKPRKVKSNGKCNDHH